MNQRAGESTDRQLKQRSQPGYYPGYETLSQQNFWDQATRDVVLDRFANVPKLHFFTPQEIPIIQAVFDHVLPQDDRTPEKRIPILPFVDQRLYKNRIDGYRFASMPPDQEAYRRGIEAIEEMSRILHSCSFVDLVPMEQDKLLETLHDGKPEAALEIWKHLPVHRFWMMLVQDAAAVYYAHPYAWDEIGFGGPAYPRAYVRLERGEAEPWEVEECRYDWTAPANSVSDKYGPQRSEIEHHEPEESLHPPATQEGSR